MNKDKLTRAVFEPTTSGLTCRRSTNWANLPYIGGLPILSISLFRESRPSIGLLIDAVLSSLLKFWRIQMYQTQWIIVLAVGFSCNRLHMMCCCWIWFDLAGYKTNSVNDTIDTIMFKLIYRWLKIMKTLRRKLPVQTEAAVGALR